MNQAHLVPNRTAYLRFFATGLLVLVLDQLTKLAVVLRLTDALQPQGRALPFTEQLWRFWDTEHPRRIAHHTVFESWWHFRYIENPGAAWGFLSQSESNLRTPFFLCVSVLAMGFILQYFRGSTDKQPLLRFALGLVLGGAVGNFIDRTRLGYVIDFIDWHIGNSYSWPTFNVADAAITVGVGLLLYEMLTEKKPLRQGS